MYQQTKIIAFDLDGTLTQHKSKLGEQNKSVLDRLAQKYKLIMVGAGTCPRIWNQMNCYPIDVIGSYGLQFATYNAETQQQELQWDEKVPVDREEILRRAMLLRDKYDLHDYAGEPMEFHPTGALTFPVLGTAAKIEDKLSYDPDRGMFLNGRPIKIRGACVHQDFGGFGIALPEGIARYKIGLLREMGMNAYRSTGNKNSL